MKQTEFNQAIQKIKELDLNGEYEISDNLKNGDYYANWFEVLWTDDNAMITAKLTEKGWMLCNDDTPFCKLDEDIQHTLNWHLDELLHREKEEARADFEYMRYREELHRNYGPGRI